MGGRVSFVANSAVPLKAAAAYYGGGIPTLVGRASRLSGPMLFFWGGLDKHIFEDERQTVVNALGEAGKVSVNVVFSQPQDDDRWSLIEFSVGTAIGDAIARRSRAARRSGQIDGSSSGPAVQARSVTPICSEVVC
jgi:dienelactone hydrolase